MRGIANAGHFRLAAACIKSFGVLFYYRYTYLTFPSSADTPSFHNRMSKSMHSTLHSLLPSRLLSHSMPNPVHSAFFLASSSAAAPASAVAVVLSISNAVALNEPTTSSDRLEAPVEHVVVLLPTQVAADDRADVPGRGANQLLLKSKKHRSDQ